MGIYHILIPNCKVKVMVTSYIYEWKLAFWFFIRSKLVSLTVVQVMHLLLYLLQNDPFTCTFTGSNFLLMCIFRTAKPLPVLLHYTWLCTTPFEGNQKLKAKNIRILYTTWLNKPQWHHFTFWFVVCSWDVVDGTGDSLFGNISG